VGAHLKRKIKRLPLARDLIGAFALHEACFIKDQLSVDIDANSLPVAKAERERCPLACSQGARHAVN
jgi:hypothetical protein